MKTSRIPLDRRKPEVAVRRKPRGDTQEELTFDRPVFAIPRLLTKRRSQDVEGLAW